MRYKFLIICFSFFFVNSLFANIASDSTRTKSTKQLVAQIKKERIKVVKKLKLIKSEAKGEKLYLDFEQTNLSLMNKIEEKERYLIYNENYNIDLKKLPDSLKSTIKLLKSANIEMRNPYVGNTYFQFESDYYLKIFKNSVAPDFKTFLEIENNDYSGIYNKYGDYNISSKQITDRIIDREMFLNKFKKNNWQRQEIKRSMITYFRDYVFGDEYTETIMGNKFTKKLIKEHLRFIEKNPKSKSVNFLRKVIAEFAKNKNRDSLQSYFYRESDLFLKQL